MERDVNTDIKSFTKSVVLRMSLGNLATLHQCLVRDRKVLHAESDEATYDTKQNHDPQLCCICFSIASLALLKWVLQWPAVRNSGPTAIPCIIS